MADKAKVIKAIECCVVNHTRCFDDNDKLCPYFTTKVYMCETELLKDTLALLKELDAEIREKNQRILELMCERDSDDGK